MAEKTKPAGRDVYVPIEPFVAQVDGIDVSFNERKTVREGHPILEKYGHLFKRIWVEYDVEAATSAPGERRGGLPGGYEA